MHILKKITTILSILTLTSCSYIYGNNGVIINRNTDYLKARSIPPLKIPPDLSSSTMVAKYPVPEKQYPGNAMRPDLSPPYLNEKTLAPTTTALPSPRAS